MLGEIVSRSQLVYSNLEYIISTTCWQILTVFKNFIIAVPPNGLVIYCGTIVTEDGKEKKVNIDFEPFRPINTSLYLCDNKFHTEVNTKKICQLKVIIIP